MRRKLGRLLAWAVTIGLLAYVIRTTSLDDLVQATRSAAGWTVPVLVGLVLVIYLADSLAIWKTFGWFVARLPFREVLVVRGATYLLAAVNYALGQGAMVYFVNRTRGVPVMRGAGAVLLVMGVNLLLLLFMATLGLVSAASVPPVLKVVLAVAYAGLAVYVVIQIAKPRWLAKRPIFDVLLGAGLGGHVKALVVRIPHLLSLMLFTFTAMTAFGVHIPIGQAVFCLPIVLFIAVLPISIQGLGTTQAAMLFFFAPYAPGDQKLQHATIVAASLLAQGIALAVQLLVGLVCLRSHLGRDIAAAAPAAPPAVAP